MKGKTLLLQLVNLLFPLTPLTSWYKLRAKLLKFAGVNCDLSARIVASCRIVTLNVSIGKDTFIGHQVLISGAIGSKITIGSNVDLAPRVVILSGTHEIDMRGNHSAGVGKGASVCIQDGVWIGANSTIAPGVTIGRKSIIGAGSVVVSDIPQYCVAVGNPCRPIKKWCAEKKIFEIICS
ncbi:MAG: acyltransferase [Chlorobium sp.]|nr:MAG: acyltransferase [Chlorobium sp.]